MSHRNNYGAATVSIDNYQTVRALQHSLRISYFSMKLLFIDSHDSFTFNIIDLFYQLNVTSLHILDSCEYQQASLWMDVINSIKPSHVIIGPGPGSPHDYPWIKEVIHELTGKMPVLGICLGHQLIIEAYKGSVKPSGTPVHGKQSTISVLHPSSHLFRNLPTTFIVGRYHSLTAISVPLPLRITAKVASYETLTPDAVMAVEHLYANTYGIQFHPESFLSEHGLTLLKNFLNISSALHSSI